jgi:NAD(P)-dependent dehydrogenase (short-subunit alcohol dehydrogenase family)
MGPSALLPDGVCVDRGTRRKVEEELAMSVADVSALTIPELVSLADRTAVVTGGARGIGAAICLRLAEAGARVVVADLDEDVARSLAESVQRTYGHAAIGERVDVADEASVERLADRAVAELGSLDIWVNNAGIYPSTPFVDMSSKEWDRVLDVNLRGTFLGSRAAARRMIEAHTAGVIINVTSTAGFRAAGPGVAHYVSSKHAIGGLTKSLAVELGPAGIRALAIAPTLIDTPGIQAGLAAFEAAGLGDLLSTMAERAPLRRNGVADDVARVALFCASDLSILMTGSTLAVDAGSLAV